MRLTPELVARGFRMEPDPGPNTDFTPLTDQERAEAADRFLADRPEGPL